MIGRNHANGFSTVAAAVANAFELQLRNNYFPCAGGWAWRIWYRCFPDDGETSEGFDGGATNAA